MRASLPSPSPASLLGASGLVLAGAWALGGTVACSSATSNSSGESGGDAATGRMSGFSSGASPGSAGGTRSGSDDGAAPGSGVSGASGASSGAATTDSDGSGPLETGAGGGSLDGASASTPVDGAFAGDARVGPGDSSAAGDASRLSGCTRLFCEDFESGKIDPNVWNVKTSGGQNVVVQSAMAAHGKYAAQFHALPNVLSYDLLITKSAPPGLSGHHFGRAYFYVTPGPPAQHTTMLFAASAGFPTFKRLEVSSIGTGLQLTSVNQTGINANSAALAGTTEAYSPASGTLPVAQWDCLEWEFNDAPDQIRVFLNGRLDAAYTNILLGGLTSGQVGGFVDFGFGYYAWHPATSAFDMFYDDIVLDPNRVGCLP